MTKYLLPVLLSSLVLPQIVRAQTIIPIVFPVQGDVSFVDSFDDPRSGGRIHNAVDVMAPKMSPVLAAVDGEIVFAPMAEPYYGYMLTLRGDDGYTYNYVHLNNDTPGTDDGNGGNEHAYVAGIESGTKVEAGEHIAWVGDSGNAEATVPHLHFEIYEGDTAINPYESLIAAYDAVSFDPEVEASLATSINLNQDITEAEGDVNCESDTLIRTEAVSTVYYCGQDGGRYVFQNEKTFFSWYDDFDNVKYVTPEVMASIPFKGVVTYKPGVYMVKLPSVPKVFAVSSHSTLRWIPSGDLAEDLYGPNWASKVHDLSEAFYPAYEIGESITW